MLERCYNSNVKNYKDYGGRGVRVCERWKHFKNFEKDAKELPGYDEYINSKTPFEYSLDKDIRGNGIIYSKENCMFTTAEYQGKYRTFRKDPKNREGTKIKSISPDGVIENYRTVNQACRELGVQNSNVYKVLNGERKIGRAHV